MPLRLLAVLLLLAAAPHPGPRAADPRGAAVATLPEFDEPRESRWIHSAPLTAEGLRGQVVLIDVWTLGCVNCARSLPWIRELDERYAGRGLVVIGVHSPEFDYEHEIRRVRAFADKNGLDYPILIDNEMRYWDRLQNRYWPTVYLVDRQGRIRHVHVGETRSGTERASEVERILEGLLDEAGR